MTTASEHLEHRQLVYHTATRRRVRRGGWALAVLSVLALVLPAAASAHGAVDPEASDALATVTHVPPGVHARIVDGDLRMWLSVPASLRVVVLDYQGGEFLRFGPHGVQINENSPMFYLNLSPPITPSIRLTPTTRPAWHHLSSGHSAEWHDGRLAALADTLHSGAAQSLGRWTIPVQVDGRRELLVGRLFYRPRPSLAWLWPAIAALLALPALLRLRESELERRTCRLVALPTLLVATIASLGAGLHGRPGLSGELLLIMAVELAVLGWAGWRLLRGRGGLLELAAVAAVAVYRGAVGLEVLWRGYVLLAVPPLIGRIAVAGCLAGGLSLAVVIVALVDRDRLSHRMRGSVSADG